jgi:ankyrin repeat protein
LIAHTPLLAAAYYGSLDVVKLLLERGADRSIKNGGKTALDLAREGKHTAVVAMLEAEATGVSALSLVAC